MQAPLTSLELEVRAGPIPRHVAVIMDGNGRWARTRGLPRLAGHREGAQSVRAVTKAARRIGCEALTLYAFSAQNWARPADEVKGLMSLLRRYLVKERDELVETDIRVEFAGDLSRLPKSVLEPLEALREDTSGCRSMTLTICLSYGGREEIVEMGRRLVRDALSGEVGPDEVDDSAVESRMWTGSLPPADLLIRTSGEQRISNFLLWGCAYSELVFVPTYWPDFRQEAFLDVLREFQRRERRFGKILES